METHTKSIQKPGKFTKTPEHGFTLHEILIVILIIGVLAAIAVPIFLNSQKASQENEVSSALSAAAAAVENEKAGNNGLYPVYLPSNAESKTVTMVYTYDDTRLEYCLKGQAYGITRYIGSNTEGNVTETACTLPHLGGKDPGDQRPDGDTTTPNNHQPVITSLNPTTIFTRKAGTTIITITGKDFLTGSVVLFDGEPISPNTLTGTKITFTSPGSATYKNVDVQVKAPNGRTSVASTLTIKNPILKEPQKAPSTTGINLTIDVVEKFADQTELTLNATKPSCTIEDVNRAHPEYRFNLIKTSTEHNTNGITKTQGLGEWQTSNTLNLDKMDVGRYYKFMVEVRCNLEGEHSPHSGSETETSKEINIPIPTPPRPTGSLTILSTPPYMAETTLKYQIPEQYCPAYTKITYYLYDNGTQKDVIQTGNTATANAGSEQRTASMTFTYRCEGENGNVSTQSAHSTALNIPIIKKPNTPATPTGLSLRTDNGTNMSYDWNAVTCNIGNPYYQYEINIAGTTTTSDWQTDTSTGPLNSKQGYDNTIKVRSKCTYSGTDSDLASYSSNLNHRNTVLNPTGFSGAPSVSGSDTKVTVSTSSTAKCTADAHAEYRGEIVRTSRKNSLKVNAPYLTGSWGTGKSTSFKIGASGVYYNGDYVEMQYRAVCVSSRTDTRVTSDTTRTTYAKALAGMPRASRWALSVPTFKKGRSATVRASASCYTGSVPYYYVESTYSWSIMLNNTKTSSFSDFWNFDTGLGYRIRVRCENTTSGVTSSWSTWKTYRAVVR